MGYVPGIPNDEVEHDAYCDMIFNGPPTNRVPPEHFSSLLQEAQILHINDFSPDLHRKLANDTARCANNDMRYDSAVYHDYDEPDDRQVQVFLYVYNSRAVGLLLFERRSAIWSCTWNGNEPPICVDAPEKGTMWSVGFIWVHRNHRRLGIATALFKEARCFMKVAEDEVGWQQPFSDEGEAFVRNTYPGCFFVVQ
jgi:GNAT superfamily N-acetyltransferase